jgi:hypothetical protein
MENIGHQGKKKSGFPSLVGKIGQKRLCTNYLLVVSIMSKQNWSNSWLQNTIQKMMFKQYPPKKIGKTH